MAWMEALTAVERWDEARDLPRIEQAFVSLAANCVDWPKPRQLLDSLPEIPVKREYFHSLPKPELTPEQEKAERERRQRIVAAQWEALGWKRKHEDA
jgi:hypothetical protein